MCRVRRTLRLWIAGAPALACTETAQRSSMVDCFIALPVTLSPKAFALVEYYGFAFVVNAPP